MPIHDYFIDNGTGANVRADINAALSAIVSLNSNPTEPGTMYAYQLWADTTSNLLKIRNSGNSAWITLRQLDGDFSIVAVEDGLQATPSLTFTNDLNTGVFRSGADALAIVTGGQYAIVCTSTQAVGIKTANPNAALHVAGNTRVGADSAADAILEIGEGATGNRTSYIDIVADTTYTDYGLRVIRNNTGANATSEIKHRGTGAFNIIAQEAAAIEFYTTNSPRVAIDSSGRLLVGTTNTAPADSNVIGVAFGGTDPYSQFSRDGSTVVIINRKTNDGDLISFKQDGTEEGTISVSGTTVSYNGAHLSRWSQLASGAERIEILRGTVLSNIDEMCEWGNEENEQLNRMKVSDIEGDKNVSGVFQAWDDDDDTYTDDFYCAMTGDFIIRIAEGVTIERGDLLMSAGDGTAKPQGDDIIRSKTIAKVTSTNVSCTYDDGSYCVPCVLMAC